jgi:hypothetical protein
MRRGRPAAPADEANAGLDEPPRVLRQVLGRHEIHVPALDVLRNARVRLRGQRAVGDLRHLLDRIQHDLGAHRAVDADDIGIPLAELSREFGGFHSEQPEAVLLQRHLRDDRFGANRANTDERLVNLVEIRECLENEEIDASR